MNTNLPFALLALTLVTAAAGHEAAAAQRRAVVNIQAQSTLLPAQAVPCKPPAKPLSAPGEGTTGCQSDGVIHPPATGDQGVVRPPETSQSMPMPVIPPPGSPGGNPNVKPK